MIKEANSLAMTYCGHVCIHYATPEEYIQKGNPDMMTDFDYDALDQLWFDPRATTWEKLNRIFAQRADVDSAQLHCAAYVNGVYSGTYTFCYESALVGSLLKIGTKDKIVFFCTSKDEAFENNTCELERIHRRPPYLPTKGKAWIRSYDNAGTLTQHKLARVELYEGVTHGGNREIPEADKYHLLFGGFLYDINPECRGLGPANVGSILITVSQ